MKMKYFIPIFAFTILSSNLSGQNSISGDTIQTTKQKNEPEKNDRNVMLNAANNTGPRDVNIGLPASIGGTTVLENGLPVVFFFWPELPTKAWRSDASTHGFQLLNLGETAINTGEVGFSVSTFDNLGTSVLRGNGSVNSNQFGLIRNSINISGPLTKNGLKFSAGAYTSLDPGSFKPQGVDRYYADKTHLYKFALTQDYKTEKLTGSISLMYKYMNSKDILSKTAPFIYNSNGKVKELDNFRLGRDSYFENSGRIDLIDAFTGKSRSLDVVNDYGSRSNTIDLISKNKLNNGLNINLSMRYHDARAGVYYPYTMGIDMANTRDESAVKYQYMDGTEYKGNAQSVLVLGSRRTPTQTFMSQFDVAKKTGNHDWKIGLQESYYNVDKFVTETTQYFQEVGSNPRKIRKFNYNSSAGTWKPEGVTYNDATGNYNDNLSLEYHNGHENKLAIFLYDKWNVSPSLTLKGGARLEYHTVRGDRLDRSQYNPETGLPYTTIDGPKIQISDNWLKKAFMLDAVYKLSNKLGLLAEVGYNEQAGQLESYSSGSDPELKKSQVPEAGFGLYYNHPMISLVSKATYIKRNEYRSTVNFSNPNNPSQIARPMTHYDIETIGWTTDAIITPFKGFALHLLMTLQSPKYKNFAGSVTFADGSVSNYDFSDKTVTGISKLLIEIDPSYTYKDLKVWTSARYFDKGYMNKPNTLQYASRWETFAGVNYKLSKNIELSCTFVNLLNQKGATGSITDGDLILTKEEAEKKNNTIISGTYIRPFTMEFGLNYKF